MLYKMLIIGNGFDLYHGLPTRYTDFLFFAENWKIFYDLYDSAKEDDGTFEIPLSENGKLIELSLKTFAEHGGYTIKEIEYFNKSIPDNPWIEYFKKSNTMKDGWVDFEEEMFRALQKIEFFFEDYRPKRASNQPAIKDQKFSSVFSAVSMFGKKGNGFNERLITGTVSDRDISPESLSEQKNIVLTSMKENMNVLNQCLRIYLAEFVSRIKISKFSEQIKKIGQCNVLNFNYTYTFQHVYDQREGGENHAIHGELKENNLVLGIADDSFPNTRDYLYFTKYFQRLQKRTGSYYGEWINYKSTSSEDLPLEIHIVGHSLGQSDKEILTMIFRSKNVGKITVYYHNQTSYEALIMNMVDLIGREDLINENLSGRIEFVKLNQAIEKAG